MKLSCKLINKINHLINSELFTAGEKKLLLEFEPFEALMTLMLAPYIPLSIRKSAVMLYGLYLNPSFTLPRDYILSFVEAFPDITNEEFMKTINQIAKTKLIIYE